MTKYSRTATPEQRFLSRIDKQHKGYRVDGDLSECWIWTAGRDPQGYGRFTLGSKVYRAHKWAYEYWRDIVPSYSVIDHLCRIRECVNPFHVEPVTVAENNRRGVEARKALGLDMSRGPRGKLKSSIYVSIEERFAARYVAEHTGHEIAGEPSECWIWQLKPTKDGYGKFTNEQGKSVPAHRWSFGHFVGSLLSGKQIDHLCSVRLCVNPEHLELVSSRENIIRKHERRGDLRVNMTVCARGHELTSDNVYVYPEGSHRPGKISCRKCHGDDIAKSRAMFYQQCLVRGYEDGVALCINGHLVQPDWVRCRKCHALAEAKRRANK